MTPPRDHIQHEYSDDDALLNHGVLGMRWKGLAHEDEIKHYGVKGMKWGVRKDGKPQGYQGKGKNKGKTSRTSVSKTKVTTIDPGPVPAGGGGGSSKNELTAEELEEFMEEIMNDPVKHAEFNRLMKKENGGIDGELIRSIANGRVIDGALSRSFTTKDAERNGLDSQGRLPNGLSPVEDANRKRKERMEKVEKTLEPVVSAAQRGIDAVKDGADAVRRKVAPTRGEYVVDGLKDAGSNAVRSAQDFLEDLRKRK